MSTVQIRIRVGETSIDIEESNLDRLQPSMDYGAPIDFDRLKEPLSSLLASALRRAADAAQVPLDDVIDHLARIEANRS